MRDTLTRENSNDFNRRYIGTYGYLIQENKKTLVYMNSSSHEETTFSDVGGHTYVVYADSGVEFEFIPVDRGFYNTVSGTYFMYRIPARQWSRGISNTNTAVYSINAGGMNAIGCTIENLYKIFQGGIDIQQAASEWGYKKREAFALGKHFAVLDTSVLFYTTTIGTVDKNKRIIIKESRVAQEFQDNLRRNNIILDVTYE